MNSVNLIGRVATEPKRMDFGGNILVTFELTISRQRNGTSVYSNVPVKVWGSDGDNIVRAGIGQQLAVIGQLEQESWTDKNTGDLRKGKIVVVSTAFLLLGMPKNADILKKREEESARAQNLPSINVDDECPF